LLRPNFFAGQLLTEDDLQQITVYQIGKRRLTNRYVFGTGVVCGLEVMPADPKTPRVVTVQPGYALDCCGNDIVLSCPYPIDVIDLIRAAKLDCGNPCAGATDDQDRHHKYYLYVKYAECLSEPVNPYSPGQATTCVNTRWQESCSFELRCPPQPVDRRDLATHLRELLHGARTNEFAVDFDRWEELSKYKADILANSVTLSASDSSDLAAAPGVIRGVVQTFPGGADSRDWTEDKLNAAVEKLRAPARTILRFLFTGGQPGQPAPAPTPGTPAPTPAPTPSTGTPAPPPGTAAPASAPAPAPTPAGTASPGSDQVAQAKQALADAAAQLRGLIPARFSEAAQTRASLLVKEIARWTNPQADLPALRNRNDVRLLLVDANHNAEPYSFDRYQSVLTELSGKYTWAHPPAGTDFTQTILNQIGGQLDEARASVDLDLRRALCEALNPPCAPCEDLGVLLGWIEVCNCEVVAVCNLVRTIILSPAAMAYWLPLSEVLPALCCDPSSRRGAVENLKHLITLYQQAGLRFAPPPERTPGTAPQPSGAT
jgi:hypothetical protein